MADPITLGGIATAAAATFGSGLLVGSGFVLAGQIINKVEDYVGQIYHSKVDNLNEDQKIIQHSSPVFHDSDMSLKYALERYKRNINK